MPVRIIHGAHSLGSLRYWDAGSHVLGESGWDDLTTPYTEEGGWHPAGEEYGDAAKRAAQEWAGTDTAGEAVKTAAQEWSAETTAAAAAEKARKSAQTRRLFYGVAIGAAGLWLLTKVFAR